MRRPLTSPTSLVLWSRGTLQSRRSRTHFLPTSTPSGKSRPLLPSKPCRTTSALLFKSYSGKSICGSPHYGHPSVLPSGGTEGDGWGGRSAQRGHRGGPLFFFSRYSLVLKKDGGLRPILDMRSWINTSTEGNLGCWRSRAFFPRFKRGTGSSLLTLRIPTSTSRWFRDTGSSSGALSGERLTNTRFFPLG